MAVIRVAAACNQTWHGELVLVFVKLGCAHMLLATTPHDTSCVLDLLCCYSIAGRRTNGTPAGSR